MAGLDISRFLGEISPDLACGEDLEYDPLFSRMETEAEGKPERQVGDSVIHAEEPDWKEVRDLALELLERTRDIRITIQLARALLHTDGLRGLDRGLSLTHGLLQRYWDCVHPQPDPEDDYPISRINALSSLNDFSGFLNPARRIPLTDSRGLGRFCLRDIEFAQGKLKVSKGDPEPPKMSLIEAAFMDTDLEALQVSEQTVTHALDQVRGITTLTSERIGVERAPDLSGLVRLLREILEIVRERLARRQASESPDGQADVAAAGTTDVSEHAAPERAPVTTVSNGIHNREDVIRSIDAMNDYFSRHEPSSPVPYILNRAKRLLAMDFMEILQDLAPDGITQAENICGPGKNDES